MEGKIFWLEDYQGKCSGGYFYRSDLFKAFEKFNSNNLKIVGIKIGDDFNIEFICEELNKEKATQYEYDTPESNAKHYLKTKPCKICKKKGKVYLYRVNGNHTHNIYICDDCESCYDEEIK